MRTTARIFIGIASIFLTSAGAAHAADCKPLAIINTVKMESIANGARYVVPVTVNGRPLKFLLDTGGVVTEIRREVARSLEMTEQTSRMQLLDVHGNKSQTKVVAQTFEIGTLQGKNMDLQIWAFPEAGQEDIDGILAGDMLNKFDVDMDFGALRLNYFSPDHCEGKVAYWPERPLAIVPFTERGSHINISVTVDGHPMRAVIDTGGDDTLMNATDFQKSFNITPGSPEAPLNEALTKENRLKTYTHAFSTLAFEGLTVTNPKITVVVDRMAVGVTTNSIRGALQDPFSREADPMVIGMNVLRKLHVYIAYGEKKLYITPAGTGESVLFKTAAPTPAP